MRKTCFHALALVYLLATGVLSAQGSMVNLARGKPAQESSQFNQDYPAFKGVDGRKDNHAMFHTDIQVNPWWQVDLERSYSISYIMLYNRTDCCAERERTVQVLLSEDGANWQRIYGHDGSDFRELRVEAGGRRARFVRVQLAEKNYLHLQEVEVYGDPSGQGDLRGNVPPPSAGDDMLINNWNPGGCGFTDNAVMNLSGPTFVESVQLWYNWSMGETSLPYTLNGDGGVIRQGQFRRGSCDPYQTAWCEATENLGMNLAPGTYTFVTARRHVCQNGGSNGMGFIHVRGHQGGFTGVSRGATPEIRTAPNPDNGWQGGGESKTLQDNWNTAACAFTNNAVMSFGHATHIDRVTLWYNWSRDETTLPYSLTDENGRNLRNGNFHRGSCDPYQATWCEAVDTLDRTLPPGYYTFTTAKGRVCQNGGSNGMGFIRMTGRMGRGGPDSDLGQPPTQPSSYSTREVYGGGGANLALGKPTQQSSVYGGAWTPDKGVDGRKDTFFHTNNENNPWWQVDLQGNYAIGYIMLYNRADCCGERQRTVQVMLSQNGSNWQTIYSHDGSNFQQVRVEAHGRRARYVRVQLAEQNYFHLGEVEVYGTR